MVGWFWKAWPKLRRIEPQIPALISPSAWDILQSVFRRTRVQLSSSNLRTRFQHYSVATKVAIIATAYMRIRSMSDRKYEHDHPADQ